MLLTLGRQPTSIDLLGHHHELLARVFGQGVAQCVETEHDAENPPQEHLPVRLRESSHDRGRDERDEHRLAEFSRAPVSAQAKGRQGPDPEYDEEECAPGDADLGEQPGPRIPLAFPRVPTSTRAREGSLQSFRPFRSYSNCERGRRLGPLSDLTLGRLVPSLRTFDRKLAFDVERRRMRPKEVSMRPPSVFVRELAPPEGQRLKRLSKRASQASTRQRAMILLASATLMSPPEIARLLLTDESHVRKVIHDFNERGFESLHPRVGGGRPRRISSDELEQIVAIAGVRPQTLGVPLTRWSLRRLSHYLAGRAGQPASARRARLGAGWPTRAPARDLHAQKRDPLPRRRARRPCRLPARTAAAGPRRHFDARLHAPDPACLPALQTHLLDPGTTSPATGRPRSAPGRRTTTSNSCRRRPTRAT